MLRPAPLLRPLQRNMNSVQTLNVPTVTTRVDSSRYSSNMILRYLLRSTGHVYPWLSYFQSGPCSPYFCECSHGENTLISKLSCLGRERGVPSMLTKCLRMLFLLTPIVGMSFVLHLNLFLGMSFILTKCLGVPFLITCDEGLVFNGSYCDW